MRKFGRVWLVSDPEVVLGGLGPEPLSESFTPQLFRSLLSKRRGMLKPLLLNQRFIAGLGNIYVDESLFRAGLHPQRTADTLQEDDAVRLYSAIRSVLQQAVDHHGTTFDGVFVRPQGQEGRQQEGLQVYGQAGLPCPKCGTPVERIVVVGRGTHVCPHCQPQGRPPTKEQADSPAACHPAEQRAPRVRQQPPSCADRAGIGNGPAGVRAGFDSPSAGQCPAREEEPCARRD